MAERKKTEVGWSTKYALTQGIEKVTVEPSESGDPKYVHPVGKGLWSALVRGRNFFTDRGEAQRAAWKMRDKKIKSLEKQISRLRALSFRE